MSPAQPREAIAPLYWELYTQRDRVERVFHGGATKHVS